MNIMQEFRNYTTTRRDIEQYHMNIYQYDVSNTIDNRLIRFAKEQDIDNMTFKNMIYEYENRIRTQCMMTIDWKENYTKILAKAYNGVVRKYVKD